MRAARQLSDRHLHHLIVAALFLFCASSTENGSTPFISDARGGEPDGPAIVASPTPTPEPYIIVPIPEPLPTPVPVDPNATPLPSRTPLPTPVPVDPNATPLAPPPPPPPPVPAPQVASSQALSWPVTGTVSQSFSASHLSLDIAAPYGTAVLAAQAGTVTWAGWRDNGGGLVVEIDHGNGMVTVYNHLSAIWVVVGQGVSSGAGIGAIGCTGWCTGPHVHFTLMVNGWLSNPLIYL